MTMAAALIADDLTGALDSAVPFALRGFPAAGAVTLNGIAAAREAGVAVVAANTESRDVPRALAARRVQRAWAELAPGRPAFLFKKLDSRLRGNVAAELGALAAVTGHARALVCPAIPSIGRIVRDGHLLGFGVSIPVPIADHLTSSDLPCDIPDCLDAETLQALASRAIENPGILAAGARGFADALAARLVPTARPASGPPLPAPDRVLMVVGSRDPITATQLARLAGARPDALFLPAPRGIFDFEGLTGNAALTVILATGDDDADPARVAAQLGDAARRLIERNGRYAVVASGGDTASAVARALGIPYLLLHSELAEGIPLSVGTGLFGRVLFATKSGGFGEPDALVEIVERLLPAPAARSVA